MYVRTDGRTDIEAGFGRSTHRSRVDLKIDDNIKISTADKEDVIIIE